MSINRVVISGNLTRDPEVRTTQSGMPVMSIGVAVNDRRRNSQTGEWEDHANYIDCTMFGNRAQNVSQYLSKGSKVTLEGKLRWSQWERDGQKRSKIEVIIDDIDFGGRGGGQSQNGNQRATHMVMLLHTAHRRLRSLTPLPPCTTKTSHSKKERGYYGRLCKAAPSQAVPILQRRR